MEKISAKELPTNVRKAFSYRKRIAFRTVTNSLTIPSQAGVWTGGSRDLYSLVHLVSGKVTPLTNTMLAPWDVERKDRVFAIEPGHIVVRTGTFCGRTAIMHIYTRA